MPGGYRFSAADLDFLISAAGDDALAAAAARPLTEASLLTDLTALRRSLGSFAPAVAQTVILRRRAVGKLGDVAAGWLLTEESLQQATPGPVARHRAARLAGVGVHDVTCSIGADLVALLAGGGRAIGSDLDPIRARMAAHNLAAAGRPVRVAVADALTRVSRGLLVYADPARRTPGGRRITSSDTLPSVAELDAVHANRPPVLRLPPGIDYESLCRPGEVEIVSLDGGAREAVLWPAELATVSRRATVLRSAAAGDEVTSDDPDDIPTGPAPAAVVGDWIVDPDAAVVRAHLVRHYAARHQLTQLDPHLAYLCGPRPPPGVRVFQVIDAAPYTVSRVADWIRLAGVGTLEIKQRGTAVIPDDLRKRLRVAMSRDTTAAATVIIARIGNQPWAFWCRGAP